MLLTADEYEDAQDQQAETHHSTSVWARRGERDIEIWSPGIGIGIWRDRH